MLRILHLENDADDAVRLRKALACSEIDCAVTTVETGAAFLEALERGGFDLVLAGNKASSFDGLNALETAQRECPRIPVLLLPKGVCGDWLTLFRQIAENQAEEALRRKSQLLASLTDSMTAFLNGHYQQANALLIQCALHQTQSERGFLGVMTEGTRRILVRDGTICERTVESEDALTSPMPEYQQLRAQELLAFDALFGEVVAAGKAVCLSQPSLVRPLSSFARVHSFLGVPIYSRNQMVGVIGVANRKPGYTNKEQELIETLVKEAGVLCEANLRREREIASEALRQQTEKALRESEERFRLIARTTHDALWDWNILTDRVLPVDRFRAFGYKGNEVEANAKSWFEWLHPEDKSRIKSSLDALINGDGESWVGEYRFRRRDGTYADVFDRAYVIRDASGLAVRMVGAMMDLTEHRRLHAERRESDERFRLLVEGVSDCAIFMLDPKGRIVSWNSGAEKLKQYHADEIIGQHFSIFYPKPAIASGDPERALQNAAANGQIHFEGWRLRRDRTQFWADVTITALRDEAGNLRGFAKLIRDVTERKYTEKVLQEKEERMRFIIESAHDAFILMDAQGLILDWNHQAERTFGWARSKVLGRPVAKTILPIKYRKAWLRGLKRYQASGKGLPLDRRFELTALHRDGHNFPVEVSLNCLQLPRGYILSAFLHDITRRKAVEEKLKQIPGEVLRAQEAERNHVARELHDSVTQILSCLKMKLQSLAPSEAEPEVRQTAVQARNLVGKCIEEVRRIAHHLMPSELDDLGLMPAIRTLCAEFRERSTIKLKLKHFRIPKDLSNDVKLALFRFVQEALTNAEKHAVARHITVEIVRKRSVIKASVLDDGKGFEPGFQSIKNPRKSGMGTANMRQRVAFVGGKFRIRSAPGRGTLIEAQIPLVAVSQTRDAL